MSSTVEWLDHNLQNRGPGNELPYSEDVKYSVRQHLLDLVAAFPTLVLKVQDYTHTDGRVVPLFVADGTLPMFYMGVKYNIPIAIWLPEKYPRVAPIMYVVPTHNMMIKPRHSFVTPSGVVNSEYVRQWSFRSSLEVLGHDTSIHFGQEPPLFQKPPQMTSPITSPEPSYQNFSSLNSQMDTFHNPINRPSESGVSGYGSSGSSNLNGGSSLWGGAAAAAANRPQERHGLKPAPMSPSPTPPRSQTPHPPGPDLKAIFRETAVKALSERLTSCISSANEQVARDTDELFEQQAELNRRSQTLDGGLAQAQGERSALETCVLELTGKKVALDRWISQNEAKSQQDNIDPDTAIVPADTLSAQALDAQAEDLALEDLLYSLHKALQDGIITAEVYMKQVRNTCYKQFMVRAIGAKVAQKQHEQRRNAMSSHQPPPSVQMPQGDLWTNPGVLAS